MKVLRTITISTVCSLALSSVLFANNDSRHSEHKSDHQKVTYHSEHNKIIVSDNTTNDTQIIVDERKKDFNKEKEAKIAEYQNMTDEEREAKIAEHQNMTDEEREAKISEHQNMTDEEKEAKISEHHRKIEIARETLTTGEVQKINGYFIKYGQDGYDWAYVTSDGKTVVKLEGINDNGSLKWTTLHTPNEKGFGKVNISEDGKYISFEADTTSILPGD